MELTNALLSLITVLLGVIGYFLSKFYDQMQTLFRDFHKAMEVQASHEARIHLLEKERDND